MIGVALQQSKTMIKEMAFVDYIAVFAFVVTLSFHDYTKIVVPAQLLFFVTVFFINVRRGFLRVPRSIKCYIVRYVCFALFVTISYVWSINQDNGVSIILSMIQCTMLSCAILYYGYRLKNLYIMIITSIIAAILLCLRLFIEVPVRAWGTERVGTYIGYGNVGVDYVLVFASIISFYVALIKKKRLYYILTILFLAFDALSGSKKGLVTFVLVVVFLLLKSTKNIVKTIRRLLIAGALVAVIIYLMLNVELFRKSVGERFINAIDQLAGRAIDKSTRDRSKLVEWSLETFIQNPIIGVGVDGFRRSPVNALHYYAHNNYLEILANFGFVGFVLYYFGLLKTLLRSIKRKYINQDYWLLGVAMLIASLILDFTAVAYTHETLQLFLAFSMVFIISDRTPKVAINDKTE